MNKPVSSELSECVFALIKFPPPCAPVSLRGLTVGTTKPHQYLKRILIKLRLHPWHPRWAGGVKLKAPLTLHCLRVPIDCSSTWKTTTITNCGSLATSALSGGLGGWKCVWEAGGCGCCRVRHGSCNGGLNIYGLLDPPVQCGSADGWLMYTG